MTSHRKRTAVLKGRTITAMHMQGETLTLTFADGATMTVKTGGMATTPGHRGTLAKIRQQGTQLALDFTDGNTLQMSLAEPTASVMVRAKDHTLEYADERASQRFFRRHCPSFFAPLLMHNTEEGVRIAPRSFFSFFARRVGSVHGLALFPNAGGPGGV
jgi:hypothetical protein